MSKEQLLSLLEGYFAHFSIFDFAAIGIFFLIFLFLILMAIALQERVMLSLFLLFLGIIVIVCAPFVIEYLMKNHIKKVELAERNIKHLSFSDATVVTGEALNTGHIYLRECTLDIAFIRKAQNSLNQLKYSLNPARVEQHSFDAGIYVGERAAFRYVIEKTRPYREDYNISLDISCY